MGTRRGPYGALFGAACRREEPMRTANRRARLLITLLAVGLLAPFASASTAVFLGAGPRFSSQETEAIGALRVHIPIEAMFALTIELNGFFDGGVGDSMSFAGGQAGLIFEVPVPGPVTPEIGLAMGLVDLESKLHGVDESLFVVNGEIGLTMGLGPIKIRGAYTLPLWSENEALTSRSIDSQLIFSMGAGF